MKKAIVITGVLATAFVATAGTGFAFGSRQGGPGFDISFAELDADGDGQVTMQELAAMGAARFDAADSDGNGVLSAEEIQARAQEQVAKRVAGMIQRFDQDGDGALSRDEMPGPRRAGRMFERFDQDGSGGISEQEFTEARAKIGEHRKGHLGGRWNKD